MVLRKFIFGMLKNRESDTSATSVRLSSGGSTGPQKCRTLLLRKIVGHLFFNIPIFCFLILIWGLNLQAGSVMDLPEALQYAKTHSPILSSFRAKTWESKAKIAQAISPEDPEVGINFYDVPASSKNPFDTREYRYSLEQKIPLLGKHYQGKMARREFWMAGEEARAKELEVLTDVKHAFHELALLDHQIHINAENQQLLESYEKIAMTRYSTSEGNFQDTLKASLEISKLEQERWMLEKEQQSAKSRLKRLLGASQREEILFETEHVLQSTVVEWGQLLKRAQKNQPSLKISQYATEKERAGVSLAKQQFVPDLKLGVEYMQRQNQEDALSYKVGIGFPLFGLWKQRSGVQEARARWHAARSVETEVTNVLEEELTVAWAELERSRKTVSLYQTAALPQAKAAVKSAQVGYETGEADFLDLLDLQRTLKNTEEEYWKAVIDVEKAVAHLEFLVGENIAKENL